MYFCGVELSRLYLSLFAQITVTSKTYPFFLHYLFKLNHVSQVCCLWNSGFRLEHWLGTDPTVSAKAIMARLAATMPDVYAGTTQLRTLQRRVKDWRTAQAKALVLGYMHNNGDFEAAASKSLDTETTFDSG